MRTAALLSLVGLLLSCKSSDKAADEQLTKGLEAALPGYAVTRGAGDRLTVSHGKWSIEINLDPVHHACASSKQECDSTIDNLIDPSKKGAAREGSSEKEALPDKSIIRLTPKPDEWLEGADATLDKFPDKRDENRLERRRFAGELTWLYVFDEPKGMRMINHGAAMELGLSPQQLHDLAVSNLANQYPELQLKELAPGFWTMEPGDYLDSARFALTEQWRAEAKKRGGTLLATLPARGRIFVVNDAKLRGLLEKVTAKAFADEDHPLTEQVFQWTDDGWKLAP
jgi:hypothetical protein